MGMTCSSTRHTYLLKPWAYVSSRDMQVTMVGLRFKFPTTDGKGVNIYKVAVKEWKDWQVQTGT